MYCTYYTFNVDTSVIPWINIWVTYFQLILLLLCQALANILQLTNMEEVILFQISTLYLNLSKSVPQNRGKYNIWGFVCKIFGRYMPTLWLISAGLWLDKRIWWECLLLKLLCRIYLLIWWTYINKPIVPHQKIEIFQNLIYRDFHAKPDI